MSISCQQCRERLGECLDAFPNPLSSAEAAPATLDVAASPQIAATQSASPAADLYELTHHIESCAQCRTDLTILRAARETMRALPMQTAPPDLCARVRTQIQSELATSQIAGMQAAGTQQTVAATDRQPRVNRSSQSTLGGWQEAWRRFFRRPASVAWASGLALAVFTVFVVQRNPNAMLSTDEPINDTPLASAPEPKAPLTAGRIAQNQAPDQTAGLKNTAPKIASRSTSSPVQAPANNGASKRDVPDSSAPAFEAPLDENSRSDTSASSATSRKQRTEAPATPPQTSIARSPRPQAPSPATRPSQSNSSIAARANGGAAVGEASIRLVWLSAVPRSAAAQSARASDLAGSKASTTARNERIEALETREFIAPRSIAKPAPSLSENGATATVTQQESARESAAQTEPSVGAARRDRAVTPFSADAASSAAPAPPVPQTPASKPDAPASLQAGTQPAAASPNPAAPRLKDSGESGGFGGGSGGRDNGFNSKQARGGSASETFDNRSLQMDAPRPSPANPDLRLSTSKPIPQEPVQRARLRVIAPRDMAQARIEVVLPRGVRVSGSKSNAITAALPHVVWRGSVRRGQSIEVDFVIDTSAAAPAATPQLTVQLVEIKMPSLQRKQPAGRNAGVQETAPRRKAEQRIIGRRSVTIPMSQK